MLIEELQGRLNTHPRITETGYKRAHHPVTCSIAAILLSSFPPIQNNNFSKMITGISHINLLVPEGTLDLAESFYADTLGFKRVPVPVLQKHELAW
jgi:4-hydroxyphenylpyruvate dioxygenase-like putative hemolysin